MPAFKMPPVDQIEKAGVAALRSGAVSKQEVDQFLELVGPRFQELIGPTPGGRSPASATGFVGPMQPKSKGPKGSVGPRKSSEKVKSRKRPVTIQDYKDRQKADDEPNGGSNEVDMTGQDPTTDAFWDSEDLGMLQLNSHTQNRLKKFKQKIGFTELTKKERKQGGKYDLLLGEEEIETTKELFKTLPGYEQREDTISGLEAKLKSASEKKSTGIDLSPLVALLKAQHGMDMSGMSKQALGVGDKEARNKAILAYGKQLQGARESKSKSYLDFLSKAKGGSYTDSILDAVSRTTEQNYEGGGSGGASYKAKAAVFKIYQDVVGPIELQLTKAQIARRTFTDGGSVGQRAFKNFLLRASEEKGPLSKSDFESISGNPSFLRKIERWVKISLKDGLLPEEDHEDMLLLIDTYIDMHRLNVKKESDRIFNQVAPYHGVSSDVARKGMAHKTPGLPPITKKAKAYDGTGKLPANATLDQKRLKLKKMKEERDAGK